MNHNDDATGRTPNIQDKLLHLGFKASASDQSIFARPDLKDFHIVLDECRLNIRHQDISGEVVHETHLHQKAALSNTHLEQHVRGAICKAFGAEAGQEITNYPYSEQRMAQVLCHKHMDLT
jgi:hypothetical protein|tara:strand:+ start:122515 stop:122877 length:363 start_codon:yes stop_codon:yes gene_type:complete